MAFGGAEERLISPRDGSDAGPFAAWMRAKTKAWLSGDEDGNSSVSSRASGMAAVAEVEEGKAAPGDSDVESVVPSVTGDSIASDSDAEDLSEEARRRRNERTMPEEPYHRNDIKREHARHNDEWEVGNFGIFFGKWGCRTNALTAKAEAQDRTRVQDKQILKCPAHMMVLCEATEEIEDMLKADPEK